MKANIKISQFSRFLLRSEYPIQVKIWKWLKLLNSVPFIKKRLLNHIYIQIWSSWLTFKVSQGMKVNIKISQFSRFLLRSHTRTLAENLKIDYFWSFSSFTVKLWKSVKMIKFKCKLDLQVVSWWMVQN